MRVLVTGGAGFIGSHFVKRLLTAGHEVVVFDKLTYAAAGGVNLEGIVDIQEGDIARDAERVAELVARSDAVVNFAAETHVDRSLLSATTWEFGSTEFIGTRVLLEAVRDRDVRFVQVSTDEVYGDREGGTAASEEHGMRPSSPYSVAKAAGDMWIPAYARTFGVNASISRGSNTYGPNQYPEKLIPLFVTNAIEGKPLPLYGDGRQVRDWLHVEDHCAGIEFVLREGQAGEAYNIGGGEERENIDVANRIIGLLGADPSLLQHVEDRPGHDRRYALDTSRLQAMGWQAQIGFEDGLDATVEWYRSNPDWWRPIKTGEFKAYYEQQYAARLAG